MATLNRNRTLHVKVTDDERRMLEELAARRGLTASDVLRQYIRHEHAATGQTEPPRRRKR
jgi:hypothetical protein